MSRITNVDQKLTPAMLLERGNDFFEQGDYLAARRDFKKLLSANAPEEMQLKAREMLGRTGIDPFEIAVGIAVFGLLIFLFVYFGLKNH